MLDTTQTVTVPVTSPRDAEASETGPEVATIVALFTGPDGSQMPARITLFQTGDAIGIGVYPTEANGAVFRWDAGITEDPTVIHWRAPVGPWDVCR
jgi:hypothetical protein